MSESSNNQGNLLYKPGNAGENSSDNSSRAPSNHHQRGSVTISANPSFNMNGAAVAAQKPIFFGSHGQDSNGNSSMNSPAPQQNQNLAVSSPSHPHGLSPSASPSPIPQPGLSGGKPPSSLQSSANGLIIGALGGGAGQDDSRRVSGQVTPSLQSAHLRRDSTPSIHNEGYQQYNNGPQSGRGGYNSQRGGRNNQMSFQHQQYPQSPNPGFRVPHRGGSNMQPYNNHRQNYNNNMNHNQARGSPAMTPAQLNFPGNNMPMQGQFQNYPMSPGPQPYGYNNFDPQQQYMQQMAYNNMQSPRMQGGPQGFPQQGYYQPPMPRTASAMSTERSASTSMSQPPPTPMTATSSMKPAVSSPAPGASNFVIPKKANKAIMIVNPNTMEAVKVADKPAPSPAPVGTSTDTAASEQPKTAKAPEPESTTSTPKPAEPTKTKEEVQAEFMAQVKQSAEISKSASPAPSATAQEEKKPVAEPVEKPVEPVAEPEQPAVKDGEPPKVEAKEEAPIPQQSAESAKVEEPKQASETKDVKEDAPAPAEPVAESELPADQIEGTDEYWERIEREMEEKERQDEERANAAKAKSDAVKKQKEAEAAAKADEDLKRQEREMEAAEDARLKAAEEKDDSAGEDLLAELNTGKGFKVVKTDTAADETPATSDGESDAAPQTTGDKSMPPPSAPSGLQSSKHKPPSLQISTKKNVEPPQPSAALQSLRSARFLQKIDDSTYANSPNSPNPALVQSSSMGKFRYDMNFLMQFQTVFTEKPSETWQDDIKSTVGDGGDTPGGTKGRGGSRQQSTRGAGVSNYPTSGFGVGNFPMGGNSLNRPNNKGFPVPQMGMMGGPRNNSNMQMNAVRNASGRGGSKRGGRGGIAGGPQHNTPLMNGQPVEKIAITANGWKPTHVGQGKNAGPPPGGENGYLAPDAVQKKVKSALNKMTPSTKDKISQQIIDIVLQSEKETDGRTLRQVIQLTFEKATDESHWAGMYAEFCQAMQLKMTPQIRDETMGVDKDGNYINGQMLFRKYLLNRCQQDFEAGWASKLPPMPKGDETVMLSDAYYEAAKAKRRGLGLVRFIGELFKLHMLSAKIMRECIKRLLDFEGIPEETEVESLTQLLTTIGYALDHDENEKTRTTMNAFFERIDSMINIEGLGSRVKFMLMDLVDLRKKDWVGAKVGNLAGPTTIEQVHQEAAAAERKKEQERLAEQRNRTNGPGGRPPAGRGDARGYPAPMPPAARSDMVTADDLRRIRGPGNRQASTATTFGPSNAFSRQASNRTMGPGGAFGRRGQDDGPGRTGTPPIAIRGAKKEEEPASTANANAFDVLAQMGGEEVGSPPSAAVSPELSKRTPAAPSEGGAA